MEHQIHDWYVYPVVDKVLVVSITSIDLDDG